MQNTVQPAGWQERNAMGLSQAQSSCWEQAVSSFEQAASMLTVDDPDDARALILGNLASVHYRSGDIDAALAAARASLEVRERIWGAGAIATLRAKSDLATIHCARGEHDVACDLLDDAVACVATADGEDSHQLVPFVENAARAAIASGDMARAEPLVLRLHGLLDAHDQPTENADDLFRFVIEARAASSAIAAEPVMRADEPVETVEHVEHVEHVEVEIPQAAASDSVDSINEIEATIEATIETTIDADISPDVVIKDSGIVEDLELTESFTNLELVEPPPPTLDQVPKDRRHVHRDDDSLGFLVQHGTTVTPDAPFDVLSGPIGPLPELARPVTQSSAAQDSVQSDVVAASVRLSGNRAAVGVDEQERPLRVTQPMALQTRGVHVRRPSREVPVVLPSPSSGSIAISDFAASEDTSPPRNSLRVPAMASTTGPTPGIADNAAAHAARPVLLDHQRVRASGGARVWLVVGGGIATLIAAVGWYLA